MLIGCLQIQNYGLGPALSVPLVPMAIFDIPRRNKWVWQSVVLASVWVSASANIVDMYTCHLYIPALKSCGNKYGQSLKTMPSTDSSSLQGLPGNAGRLCHRASRTLMAVLTFRLCAVLRVGTSGRRPLCARSDARRRGLRMHVVGRSRGGPHPSQSNLVPP